MPLAPRAAAKPTSEAIRADRPRAPGPASTPRYRGLGWAELRWMFTATWMGHYIPLTWLTLGLNHALGGMNPAGYHLGNLLIHLAAALTLFGVVRRTLMTPRLTERFGDSAAYVACAVTLVWVVHPLTTESVTYVISRSELLMALCYLATLDLVLLAEERPR